MANDNKVYRRLREKLRQGRCPQLRVVGKIPAVIYGHGTDPVHVALPAHQMALILRKANACSSSTSPATASSPWSRTCRRTRFARSSSTSTSSSSARARRFRLKLLVHIVGRVLPGHHRRPGRQDPPARGRGHPHPATSSSTSRASKTAPRSTPRTSRCPRALRSSPTPTPSSSHVLHAGREAKETQSRGSPLPSNHFHPVSPYAEDIT